MPGATRPSTNWLTVTPLHSASNGRACGGRLACDRCAQLAGRIVTGGNIRENLFAMDEHGPPDEPDEVIAKVGDETKTGN